MQPSRHAANSRRRRAALAKAVVDALRQGIEDVYVGDVAQDVHARLAVNPKALERELGG